MIEFDYKIDRNEGNETVSYAPKLIPQLLHPLVYIEGPNSSGKSTLLNLIALAFNGHKRKEINENLRNKINELLDVDHQSLDFKISISYEDKKLNVSKSNNSDKIIRSIESSGITKDQLVTNELIEEKFNLIYDIPENPITRLTEMSQNLHLAQTKQLDKISEYIEQYRQILTEVVNSRDENRINELEIKLADEVIKYSNLEKEIYIDKSNLSIIQKYVYTRSFRKTTLDLKELDDKINDYNKKGKQVQKKRNQEYDKLMVLFDKNYSSIRSELDKLLINLDFLEFDDIKIKEFIKFQKNPIHEFSLIQKKYYNLVDDTVTYLSKIDKSSSKKIMSKISAYNDLIEVLAKYQSDDLELPGENGKFYDLLITLKKEVNKDKQSALYYRAIDDSIDLLKSLRITMKYIDNTLVPKYKMINKGLSQNESLHADEISIERLEEKKYRILDIQKRYSSLCIDLGINLTDEDCIHNAIQEIKHVENHEVYHGNSDEDNIRLIDEMSCDLDIKRARLDMMEQVIKRDKEEFETIKKMKPHKLHGKSTQIENIIKRLMKNKSQLRKYNEYLEMLLDKAEHSLKSDDIDMRNYFEKVSLYLGNHLGQIRHIDLTYDVRKVDLLSKRLITTSGKVIRFNDMGTGQSQAAYLLSRLSSIDDRKVVVLFDEIAMMDKMSLKPVLMKINELHQKNKLICAIVVQKSDELAVRPLGDII
jgi:exonuclease SbcC